METIGVIGLGIIGTPWAARYHAAGKLAGVWSRTPKPQAPGWKASAREVAAAADVTHIVVADPPAVAAVLDEILPALGQGKAVVQSSTIDPASATAFEARVRATGAAYVESPFTGSKPAAESGTIVFFMGGDAAALVAVEPLLALVSDTRFHLPSVAQAAALKLAMNLNIAGQMQALSESLTCARRAGIADDFFFQVLAKNVSYSGLAKLKEGKLKTRDFSPQFSIKHMHKDMRLAEAAGDGKLPLLATVRGCLARAEQQGMADDDFSSLIRLLDASPTPKPTQ
jgi:3-hydroxyisobutyrate dehydrogenase-like beta-hydroxyacid dehydrogenase